MGSRYIRFLSAVVLLHSLRELPWRLRVGFAGSRAALGSSKKYFREKECVTIVRMGRAGNSDLAPAEPPQHSDHKRKHHSVGLGSRSDAAGPRDRCKRSRDLGPDMRSSLLPGEVEDRNRSTHRVGHGQAEPAEQKMKRDKREGASEAAAGPKAGSGNGSSLSIKDIPELQAQLGLGPFQVNATEKEAGRVFLGSRLNGVDRDPSLESPGRKSLLVPQSPASGWEIDHLKAEISRKRQLVEDTMLLEGSKRYFKRSKLARKEEEAYFGRCASKIQPQEKDENPLTSFSPVAELDPTEEKLPVNLSRQEIVSGLRGRGEPVRLFGETDYDAFQRLRKMEILMPEVNKGLKNDLKAALDEVEQQHFQDIVAGEDTQKDLKAREENTTFEEFEVLGQSLGRGDDYKDMDFITRFLKFLLGVWTQELQAREEHVKCSAQGKLNSAAQKQTESYLRPLFRKLQKKANEAYLQMAIGNAPWPIGVTMVGIHARTGREKIFSKHVAHVLNDETQRKFIQGLKRLMTLCQMHFSAHPSKCVEYNAL
ncbi:pre-mRNA-splicing factor 18-like [Antechinus flavipes]|uniref:pre-mRNA-splicing factor 18-like n=1 Tax=Antechinus flavipes TaxID=38775 RepID=UPI0022354735|nr:pre-mRNA-splicing factor 18-like [Antechinus flavipes]